MLLWKKEENGYFRKKMEEILHNTRVLTLKVNTDLSLIIQVWHQVEIVEKEYKENMLAVRDANLKFGNIQKQLVYPNLLFPIVPELQEWTDNIFSSTNPVEKVAFIFPKALESEISIPKLSVEQTMEESRMSKSDIRYFFDEQEAKSFLSI